MRRRKIALRRLRDIYIKIYLVHIYIRYIIVSLWLDHANKYDVDTQRTKRAQRERRNQIERPNTNNNKCELGNATTHTIQYPIQQIRPERTESYLSWLDLSHSHFQFNLSLSLVRSVCHPNNRSPALTNHHHHQHIQMDRTVVAKPHIYIEIIQIAYTHNQIKSHNHTHSRVRERARQREKMRTTTLICLYVDQ